MLLKSGPEYTIDFNEAKSQGITTPTSKEGTYAQGFTLQWKKGVPTFLPHELRVPKWCYLHDPDTLVYVETKDSYAEDLSVWERVGKYVEEENAATFVHLYYNYMLKQPCFVNARGCGPIIPLLDIQQWGDKPHAITPIFADCNRWRLRDELLMDLFWKIAALYGLLVLDATGIAHLDLSTNNVFKSECRSCCVQYKDKMSERIYLPWTPVLTDFDDYSVAWRSAAERQLKEREGVTTLLCKHWTNANFYTSCVPACLDVGCSALTGGVCRRDARKHEQWMKDVLRKYEQTNMESTIMYIMAHLKPILNANEYTLRTTTYPESVQHHFDTTLYVDDFVTSHKSHIRKSMSKFTVRWEVPRYSIKSPYSCNTSDNWRNNCRRSEFIINMSEVHKRSFDLLLS